MCPNRVVFNSINILNHFIEVCDIFSAELYHILLREAYSLNSFLCLLYHKTFWVPHTVVY